MKSKAMAGVLAMSVLLAAPGTGAAQEHAHRAGPPEPAAPCVGQNAGDRAMGMEGMMRHMGDRQMDMGMGEMGGMMGEVGMGMGRMAGMADGGAMDGHGSAMMAARTGIVSPGTLLWQRAALGLSDDQVGRLEKLDRQLAERRAAHAEAVREIGRELEQLRPAPGERTDVSRLESLLGRLAKSSIEMRVEAARTGNEALEVLTREQRSNVRYGLELMRSMMQERMGAGMMPERTGGEMMREKMGGRAPGAGPSHDSP